MKQALLTLVLLIASVIAFNCARQDTSPPREIPHVDSNIITVTDTSLKDWNGILPIYNLAADNQWEKIRGRSAEAFSGPEDISAQIFLSWNGEFLFFAVDVIDDKVFISSEQTWSGDCAELFFVGFDSRYKKDYQTLVEQKSEGHKNVFQLIAAGGNYSEFPSWRTDGNTKSILIQNGFSAMGWKTATGWQAEAKIPLAKLGNVLEIARSGQIVKIGIDVLDYDQQIAPNTERYKWGYHPDNVLSNSSSEAEVNQPNKMGRFVFQKESSLK